MSIWLVRLGNVLQPYYFPDDRALLGQYLGPAIDVGSMLTAKILKPNGQYVCRSTLWHLDDNEQNSEVHKANQLQFDQVIEEILGTAAKLTDFDKQDLTPENIHYEGDADSIDPDHGDLEITPEMGDNYIGAKIMTPRGGVLLRGQVIRKKQDTKGNPVGRSHTNSVQDTQSYIMEFDDNNQTESWLPT